MQQQQHHSVVVGCCHSMAMASSTIRFLLLTAASVLYDSGPIIAMAFSPPRTAIKVGITASHDGGNIEVVSIGEPVISGRTAKVTVSVNIKPGEWMELHS